MVYLDLVTKAMTGRGRCHFFMNLIVVPKLFIAIKSDRSHPATSTQNPELFPSANKESEASKAVAATCNFVP